MIATVTTRRTRRSTHRSRASRRSIPRFTVGAANYVSQDIQVTRVETPRIALKGTSLVVNIVVTQTGYAGATVPLEVQDNGHIVSTEEITLPPNGESATIRVHFTAADAGPRVFTFRIAPQPNEQVTQNNAREALIEVSDRREQILYFEGQPRPEATFVKRAVEDDKNLQVVLLRRTAPNKYYRQNLSAPDDLVAGFPATREELFAYRGVISTASTPIVHAGALRMLADFGQQAAAADDARRPSPFAEGGWTGRRWRSCRYVRRQHPDAISPSRCGPRVDVRGCRSPILEASAQRWQKMRRCRGQRHPRRARAQITARGTRNQKKDQIVPAVQRAGAGAGLRDSDSWLWRWTRRWRSPTRF